MVHGAGILVHGVVMVEDVKHGGARKEKRPGFIDDVFRVEGIQQASALGRSTLKE